MRNDVSQNEAITALFDKDNPDIEEVILRGWNNSEPWSEEEELFEKAAADILKLRALLAEAREAIKPFAGCEDGIKIMYIGPTIKTESCRRRVAELYKRLEGE